MIRRPPRSPLFPYTPLSRSPLAITAARVLQGLGIAMILPGAYAVVPTLIPPRFRGTALGAFGVFQNLALAVGDRKSTRLNSSHSQISYAVFCLKKKQKHDRQEDLPHVRGHEKDIYHHKWHVVPRTHRHALQDQHLRRGHRYDAINESRDDHA